MFHFLILYYFERFIISFHELVKKNSFTVLAELFSPFSFTTFAIRTLFTVNFIHVLSVLCRFLLIPFRSGLPKYYIIHYNNINSALFVHVLKTTVHFNTFSLMHSKWKCIHNNLIRYFPHQIPIQLFQRYSSWTLCANFLLNIEILIFMSHKDTRMSRP